MMTPADSNMAMSEIARAVDCMRYDFLCATAAWSTPTAIMRPTVEPDGNMWCALYGKNIQEGVAGFGETPQKACEDFDRNWHNQKLAGEKGGAG